MDKEKVNRLLELKQLYEAGILTEEEMISEKQKVLNLPDSDNSFPNHSNINTQEPALLNQNGSQASFEKITIHGYEGFFLINPNISIYSDGKYVGEVGRNEELELETDGDCLLKFSSGIRSASIRIRKGIDTHVFIYFNRFTGTLNVMKSGDSDYFTVSEKRNSITSNANIYSIILVVILLLIAWFLRNMYSEMTTLRF